MKKLIFLLVITVVITSLTMAQLIPFTNTTRIYDLDTGYVMKFYKIQLPQAGFKNFYIQRGGNYNVYDVDMRYGTVYKLIYYANGFTDSAHFRRLSNSWSLMYGYNMGYVEDFTFSPKDTNLLLYTYWPPDWEPYASASFSRNDGQTLNTVFPATFMGQCGGVAIDPVNDSIMFCTFQSNTAKNVFKTTNRGANWFSVDTLTSGILYCKIFVNKFSRNTIFINQNTSLYRSSLGGAEFEFIKSGVSNARMYFDEIDNTIYMSSTTVDGFLKSTNNGTNWTTLLNKAVNDFEFDPMNSNFVYAGCGDGLYKSINKGSTWALYNNSFMPDINVKGIVKNPNSGDTLYVATNKAVYKVYEQSILDSETTKYLPLSVGNLYVYEYSSVVPPLTDRYKVRITKDTVVSGKRFFFCSWIFPGFNSNENWIRIDGMTGVISSLSNSSCNYLINEKYVDSLRSRINDTLYKCNPYSKSTCIDTSSNNIFGFPSKQKVFSQDGAVLNHRTYSKYFGLTTSDFWEGGNVTHILKGCKINGVTYGDTLLTIIKNVSSEIPTKFSISQNYPNPFNPTTTIRFEIPASPLSSPYASIGDPVVTLKVFDMLGREAATLVNEKLAPGTYTVDWNASQYPSGVYFYRLTTERFSDTKKMLVVK